MQKALSAFALFFIIGLSPAWAQNWTSIASKPNYSHATCKVVYKQVMSKKGPIVVSSIDCGNNRTCPDGTSCCDSGGGIVCCPEDEQHYCASNDTCYASLTDAENNCGDSVTVCYKLEN